MNQAKTALPWLGILGLLVSGPAWGDAVITTASPLPGAFVGTAYNLSLTYTSTNPPAIFWQVSSGSLPPGVTLTPNGGCSTTPTISGTPTTAGTYNFQIRVAEAEANCVNFYPNNIPNNTYNNLTITVTGPPTITTASLPSWTNGVAYSQTLAATGGVGQLLWSATGVPSGLTLSASGVLSGTPTASGTFPIQFTATDANNFTGMATLNLTINPPVTITTTSLSPSVTGAPFSQNLAASGGTGGLTWTATGLPSGVTLSTSGTLSGTAASPGTIPIQFTATDTLNSSAVATLSLTVIAPIVITTPQLPQATVDRPYSYTLQATGGTGQRTWTATGIPSCLSLSSAGVLSGVPSETGLSTLYFTVTDTSNATPVAAYFSLTVNAPPSISTSSLPGTVAGSAYSQTLQVAGGTSPFVWSASGIPAGLNVSSGGVVSGTPTVGGSFSPLFTVTDAAGASATRQIPLEGAIVYTIQTVPAGQRFVADNQQYTAPQNFNWAVGSTHVVGAVVPTAPNPDTRYSFGNWSDNGDVTHSVNVTGSSTLTVTYVLQHRLQTAFTPPFAGSVTLVPPSPDGFYTQGVAVGAQATVNTGFRFLQWGGAMAGNVNPGSLIVAAPGTVFANFQQAPACEYSLGRNSLTVLPSGYSGRVEVSTGPGCSWTAGTAASWIGIRSGSGSGIGSVVFDVTPNPDRARSGIITVADLTLTILQDAVSCSVAISPSSVAAAVEGGTYAVDVTTPAPCTWSAAANPGFVQLPVMDRVGSASVPYSVTRNPDLLPRTGSVVAGGLTQTILQKAGQMTELYRDVPSSHPFHDSVYLATLNNLTAACQPGLYCPDQALTRAEMAEFIVKALLGKEVFTADTPYFTDVPASHPQFRFIQKMKELGITSGCTATTYCPGATSTRLEMAVFLTRAKLGLMAGQSMYYFGAPFFDDVPASSPFFAFAQKMRELGITTGCTATSYCPNAIVTKGQMATFVVRGLLTK